MLREKQIPFDFAQDDNSKQRQEQMQRQPQVLRFAQDDNSKNTQVPFGFAQGRLSLRSG
jgi:hypothetical protein